MDVTTAAKTLLADTIHTSSNVIAFQQAWNAAGKTPRLSEDGIWGPNTASALGNYGTVYQGTQQPRVQTTVTAQQLANMFASVWPLVVGGTAPTAGVLILVAQSAFETGAWKSCWNWNFGNIKHNTGDGTDWFTMTASEGEGENEVMVSSMFRSYPTFEMGAKAYLAFMHRFGSSWSQVLDGDPEGFVQALKDENYFTGNLDQYIAGTQRYWKQFQDILPTVQQLETGAKIGGIGLGGLILAIGAVYGATKAYQHRAVIGGYIKDKYEVIAPGGKKHYTKEPMLEEVAESVHETEPEKA